MWFRRRQALRPYPMYRQPRRWWQRVADPVFYLRAVMVIAGVALVAIPILADGVLAIARPVGDGADKCRIIHVVDGDTADFWCAATGFERARFVGYDAPELFSPKCASELLAAQKSKWALRGYIYGAADLRMKRGKLDRYGRRLVTLSLGPDSLSDKMVAAGYGRDYKGGVRSGWCD